MVDLIKGVTKIKWVGDNDPKITFSLFKYKEDTYLRDLGIYGYEWLSPEGVSFIYCSRNTLKDDKDSEITNTITQEDLKLNKNTEWTDKHYNHYLTVKLTPEDIAAGEVKVKVDPYVVNELWGINTADKTGAGFHCLKTLSRMVNNKNSLEREWDALIGQSTRARELLKKD
jgi:hypothetical protein